MTSPGETMRLFVAIEPPQTWIEALAGAQRALAAAFETPQTPRLRWVHPEGIHLTLKFIGNLPSERLDEILGVLTDALPESPGLMLSLGEPGLFEAPWQIALWVGVRGDTRGLEALATTVDIACARLGVQRERRGFTPHLTLARVPDQTSLSADDVREEVARLDTIKAPTFEVERVSLMRSHPGPAGSRYERIAAFPGDA